jgi:hypothetical protein
VRGRRAGAHVAANLAAVILTDSAPAPQRLSSLFPALQFRGPRLWRGWRAESAVPSRGPRRASRPVSCSSRSSSFSRSGEFRFRTPTIRGAISERSCACADAAGSKRRAPPNAR